MKEAREKGEETEDVQRSQAPRGAARLLKNGFGASKAD